MHAFTKHVKIIKEGAAAHFFAPTTPDVQEQAVVDRPDCDAAEENANVANIDLVGERAKDISGGIIGLG